jgi:glycosyltransferase involved in cell wall biosynthesis
MQPTISIIIPTYNASSTIRNLLTSCTNQTYKNIEIIIIDGASKDDTIQIVQEFSPHIAKIITEKDKGIYDAMNKGINNSTGEWILFMGADDILSNNNIINEIFSKKDYSKYELVYGRVKIMGYKQILGDETTAEKIIENNIPHQAIFYNKKVFQIIGNYNLKYKILADYELNYRIFQNTSIHKLFIPIIVSEYNKKGMSNYTLDEAFYVDMLDNLTKNNVYTIFNPNIQQYIFFSGVINILKKQYFIGIKKVFHAIIYSKRKIFTSLLFIRIILKMLGIGNKLKYV